jgi:E3 ubiquitin-protein ligase UBR7
MEAGESLQEYLKQQDALDKEARALFPYDFSSCSFEQGYVKQQVFACLTCTPATTTNDEGDAKKLRGGVCYSCSIACHGDHELVELFNKRHFRCDCGSDRIDAKLSCTLLKARRHINTENRYNQNYDGLFCWCCVAYDPEKESRTMFQCLQCEDWYHDSCIRKQETLPDEELFDQFICRTCVADMAWLKRYAGQRGFDAHAAKQDRQVAQSDEKTDEDDRPTKRVKLETESTPEPEMATGRKGTVEEACTWVSLPEQPDVQSLFLQEDFRSVLCTCEACVLRAAPFPFLKEEEDVYDPPEDDDADGESVYEAGARAMQETLDRLPRQQAIEGVLQYAKLKEHLTRCLRPLAEQGEIVTAEHVRAFFQQQKQQ